MTRTPLKPDHYSHLPYEQARRYRLKLKGLCSSCGKLPLKTLWYCDKCRLIVNRGQLVRWHKTHPRKAQVSHE